MSEYTKGPWKAQMYPRGFDQKESYEVFADDKDGTYIAGINEDNPDYKGNAQLIAAAPELLEAAEEILETVSVQSWIGRRLYKAIRKAKGDDE